MNNKSLKDNQWKSGQSGNPAGRPKGSKNKFTDLKQVFLDTFESIETEGEKKDSKVKTLYEWATTNARNQGLFYQMMSKMLPSNIGIEHSGLISLTLSDKFLPKDDNGSKSE